MQLEFRLEMRLDLLKTYDSSADGTIGEEELRKILRALDQKSFWTEAAR